MSDETAMSDEDMETWLAMLPEGDVRTWARAVHDVGECDDFTVVLIDLAAALPDWTLARVAIACGQFSTIVAGMAERRVDELYPEFPPYPCPHDPDGQHFVGCGCSW